MNNKNGSITNIFLAVELDDDTKQVFARKLFLLDYKDELRIEPKRNLHITLGYIPSVHETQRREIINAFKPLRECHPFSAHVEGPILLGHYQHMMCVQHSPYEPFFALHMKAKELLSHHTEFRFDEKHPNFIPHTKIQTLRKNSGHELHQKIIEEFESINFRKIDFKIKTLALMHRIDHEYHVLYRYELKKASSQHQRNETEKIKPLQGELNN